MADVTETDFKVAEARGRVMQESGPCAQSARYDAASGRVVLELADGCAYAFPARRVEDLVGASDADLASVLVVDGAGFNLHWPALAVDLFVPALITGVFSTRDFMARELARHAGRARSPAKRAAAQANGAKGGRPRKLVAAKSAAGRN